LVYKKMQCSGKKVKKVQNSFLGLWMTTSWYGYVWLARQISRVGSALLVNQRPEKVTQLVYTLQTLGLVNKEVVWVTESSHTPPMFCRPTAPGVYCVVLCDNSVLYNCDVQLLTDMISSKQFLLLVCTTQVGTVPPFYLQYLPCMLWNMGRYVHVPWVAGMYHVVNKFMRQERSALLHQGDVFLDDTTDCCVTVDLRPRFCGSAVLICHLQRAFRTKRRAAVTLQRCLKQWLYRPDAGLGNKIIVQLQQNGVTRDVLY